MPETLVPGLINPLDLEDSERDEYIQRLQSAWYIEDQVPQDYIGSRDLIRLIKEKAVGVGVVIRFWQKDLPEFNALTLHGLMPLRGFNGDSSTIIKYPFTRLDRDPMGHPYHWNIEGYELITNREVEDLIIQS
jgi:hypothetical protein